MNFSNNYSNVKTLAQEYDKNTRSILKREQIQARLVNAHRASRYVSLDYRLGDSSQVKRIFNLEEPLAAKSGVDSVLALRKRGVVSFQYSLDSRYEITYHLSDIQPGTIGLDEHRQSIPLWPTLDKADFNPATCIIGEMGSGKSNLLTASILSLIKLRQPDRLQFAITDTKRNLSMLANIPYLIAPIAQDKESQSQLINHVKDSMLKRQPDRPQDYPLLILVIDEPALLDKADYGNLEVIASTGRALYVWVVIGSQQPHKGDFAKLYGLLNNRFSGKVTLGRSYQVLGVPRLNADRLLGKGDFLRVNLYDPQRFQVPLITQADYESLPRAEIVPIEHKVIEVPNITTRPVGRPQTVEIERDILAAYVYYQQRKLRLPQINTIAKVFGFTGDIYYQNRLYVEAAKRFVRVQNYLAQKGGL